MISDVELERGSAWTTCEVGHDDLLAGLAAPTHLHPLLDALLGEV